MQQDTTTIQIDVPRLDADQIENLKQVAPEAVEVYGIEAIDTEKQAKAIAKKMAKVYAKQNTRPGIRSSVGTIELDVETSAGWTFNVDILS